jgi:hypothetical protein
LEAEVVTVVSKVLWSAAALTLASAIALWIGGADVAAAVARVIAFGLGAIAFACEERGR